MFLLLLIVLANSLTYLFSPQNYKKHVNISMWNAYMYSTTKTDKSSKSEKLEVKEQQSVADYISVDRPID